MRRKIADRADRKKSLITMISVNSTNYPCVYWLSLYSRSENIGYDYGTHFRYLVNTHESICRKVNIALTEQYIMEVKCNNTECYQTLCIIDKTVTSQKLPRILTQFLM